MTSEQERQLLTINRDILCQLHVTHVTNAATTTLALSRLASIDTTLNAIRESLLQLEMKK